MKSATAPSPFTRAPQAVPVPDRFLPGDGGSAPVIPSHTHPRPVRKPTADPLTTPDFQGTNETVRAMEERLARLRAEEEAARKREAELLEFEREVNDFQTRVATTLQKLRDLEDSMAEEGADARRAATSIHRTIQVLQDGLTKIDRVHPERWTKSQLKAELDYALDLLADVEHDRRSEMARLQRELPKRIRDGWMSRTLYWLSSAFAFLLPLLVFVAVAVILLLTALGLV